MQDRWLVTKPRHDGILELVVQEDAPTGATTQFVVETASKTREAVVVSPFGIHVFSYADAEYVADKLVSLASLIRREVPKP